MECKLSIRIGEEAVLKTVALNGVQGSNPWGSAIPADSAVVKNSRYGRYINEVAGGLWLRGRSTRTLSLDGESIRLITERP